MELKEFVKETIADITNAIAELQREMTNGAVVNPTLNKSDDETGTVMVDGKPCRVERINFDVAVTVAEASGVEGGAKTGIAIMGAKIGTAMSAKAESCSRLTFSVPMVYPAERIKTTQEMLKNPKKRPVFDISATACAAQPASSGDLDNSDTPDHSDSPQANDNR